MAGVALRRFIFLRRRRSRSRSRGIAESRIRVVSRSPGRDRGRSNCSDGFFHGGDPLLPGPRRLGAVREGESRAGGRDSRQKKRLAKIKPLAARVGGGRRNPIRDGGRHPAIYGRPAKLIFEATEITSSGSRGRRSGLSHPRRFLSPLFRRFLRIVSLGVGKARRGRWAER